MDVGVSRCLRTLRHVRQRISHVRICLMCLKILMISRGRLLDLFAGTGAISFEFLSRGCSEVTAVELSPIQSGFIRSVKEKLGDESLRVIKGDVFKFIATCHRQFDFIFADPPYDHPRFEEVPEMILSSGMVKHGTVVIIEHSKTRDFSRLPGFSQHRVYGSVNFSIFVVE